VGGRAWTEEEVRVLVREWHLVSVETLMQKLPGRTWQAIVRKARGLRLPFRVPQGHEALHRCALRQGVHVSVLRKALEAAGARIYTSYPSHWRKPHRRKKWSAKNRYVEIDEADRAASAWLALETLTEAARRLGVGYYGLRHRLRRMGVAPGVQNTRLAPAVYDRAMALPDGRRKS
jgi:hypothetical protein